jgi:hypothetical protein
MALARTGGSSSWRVDANDGCGITEDYDEICWVSCAGSFGGGEGGGCGVLAVCRQEKKLWGSQLCLTSWTEQIIIKPATAEHILIKPAIDMVWRRRV